ncbi:3-oxoacyl-(acyl-carrier-protein) reductase FabG [Frankia canadensis]|uniref:3-oxoacyl-(Acyl-carrier-protein) reductase FabG n=1 Tax=Frankia canadensis TaxID=1836972 RepID=A0A2I2KY51_9ACTN|nr:SDR family NAD(P)-dependent oxidoreductase [Frankia canadensis]SNQ50588.1 3-oxoacyl-(acyl-carrier-protein) reductase FabG [Frankia canadensis]SOU57878.1 3-oxoacyl-(acyl-carrier-protein) reductase FabG [Frankia canadensis]
MSITFDFTGRTAVVTGGAQGIGLEIATLFHRAGARVAVLDRDPAALEKAWPADMDRCRTHAVDVSDSGQVAAAIDDIARWAGSVDIAVNNAGITRDTVVWKMSDEQWQAVLDVHLKGTFLVTRAVVPYMRAAGFGRIVNVTSYTGLHGTIGQANYAAAKGGIVAFTKTVAKEVARFGITVNAISPNAATAMVKAVGEERLAAMTATVPLGRFAEPAEMATAVGYLAADESAYVTGVVLPVDGGLAI